MGLSSSDSVLEEVRRIRRDLRRMHRRWFAECLGICMGCVVMHVALTAGIARITDVSPSSEGVPLPAPVDDAPAEMPDIDEQHQLPAYPLLGERAAVPGARAPVRGVYHPPGRWQAGSPIPATKQVWKLSAADRGERMATRRRHVAPSSPLCHSQLKAPS